MNIVYITAQLIETIHDFSTGLDMHEQIDVIFIDFAKAIEKVPNDRLLYKLRWAGLS